MLSGKPRSRDAVDHALVQVDHRLALVRGVAARQCPDELLLLGDGSIAGVLNQPVDQPDPRLDLRHETEGQQDLGPMIGVLREVAQEADDRVGVQQLRHAVVGALIALEIEPALLTFSGGDQDHAAVVDHLVVDRQRVGGGDTGTFAVVHGAGYADEHDALEPGVTQGRSAARPGPPRP